MRTMEQGRTERRRDVHAGQGRLAHDRTRQPAIERGVLAVSTVTAVALSAGLDVATGDAWASGAVGTFYGGLVWLLVVCRSRRNMSVGEHS